MLLGKDIEIVVYEMNNTKFEPLGPINKYTALIWGESFRGYSEFELWCPINEENKNLIKVGNVIWIGGNSAGIIENIRSTVDKKGVKSYDIKGRSLEALLYNRIVWGVHNDYNRPSTIMYNLVNLNCINPTDLKRKINYLAKDNDGYYGDTIRYQKTGGTVYEAIKELSEAYDLGFNVDFDPNNKRMIFKVMKITDKSINNIDGNEVIELSTDLSDILESEYYINSESLKNVALVQGEGEDVNRKSIITGNNNLTGFNRKEMYVDARDLQSKSVGDDGEEIILTPTQYNEVLTNRGNQKLSECIVIENFDASIRQFGKTQYQFGVDYKIGDIVTVVDNNLSVEVDAIVYSVQHEYKGTYNISITFGFAYPTLLQRIKNVIS